MTLWMSSSGEMGEVFECISFSLLFDGDFKKLFWRKLFYNIRISTEFHRPIYIRFIRFPRYHNIGNTPCLLRLPECNRNSYFLIDFEAKSPELIVHLHICKRNRYNWIIFRLRFQYADESEKKIIRRFIIFSIRTTLPLMNRFELICCQKVIYKECIKKYISENILSLYL